jgi:hypothetical protein
VITCPICHRFVKVNCVEIWQASGDIKRVDATCTKHGIVDADFTDYDELVSEETSEHAEHETERGE